MTYDICFLFVFELSRY